MLPPRIASPFGVARRLQDCGGGSQREKWHKWGKMVAPSEDYKIQHKTERMQR